MSETESSSMKKLHRVLRLLTLIQGKTNWNAERLAGALQVDVRSVYRYLEDLEQAGIPYSFDRESDGYRVRGDVYLPPVQLLPEEALALSVLCAEVAGREQVPYMRPAERALRKIEAALPPRVRHDLAAVAPAISMRMAQTQSGDGWQATYELVRAAIAQRRVLRCAYEPGTPAAPGDPPPGEFDLEPYALLFSVRAWYVVGKRSDRDAPRSLKLTRFLKCTPTDRTFPEPGFSMEEHLGNAWRMMRGERDFDVEIEFDAEFTPTLSDTQWHRTQSIEEREDGSSVFRCTVSGLDEIVWWVMSMGPHCRVVKPRELAERVRELARRTAANYEDAGG
ncbi:MAG: WYL domain-containing protein [Planctomycetota bacterium]|nr:WYL domain-containing protein [Planctomycetota bacterium]